MSYGNARTLLDRVGVKVEHSPQDRNTREARLDILNRYLSDVSSEQPWRFLQTEADFKVWYKRNNSTTGFTVSLTNGSTDVTVSGALGVDFALNNAGMEFNDGLEAAGGASVYTIGRFTNANGAAFELDRPYEGATAAALTTWWIGNDKVLLPVDCGQPMGFIDRVNGRGRLISWDRRREEMYLSTMSTGGDVWWIVDGDTPYDRPPDSTFRGTLSTAAGTLEASSIYQYAYTFTQFGRESPPSIIVEVTTGSGVNNQVLLAGIENTQTSGLSVGKQKKLYRRQVSRSSTTLGNVNGPWMLLANAIGESNTTYADTNAITPTRADSSSLYYEGPSQFMRPKADPVTDETLRVRYLQRVRKLVSDSDIPARWPSEYYDMFVLMTAMDVVGSNSELAKARDWERAAQGMKKRAMSGWVQVPDLPTQRQMWGVGGVGSGTVRAGVVTSDYSG